MYCTTFQGEPDEASFVDYRGGNMRGRRVYFCPECGNPVEVVRDRTCDVCRGRPFHRWVLLGMLRRDAWDHIADRDSVVPLVVGCCRRCFDKYGTRAAKRTTVNFDPSSERLVVFPTELTSRIAKLGAKIRLAFTTVESRWFNLF